MVIAAAAAATETEAASDEDVATSSEHLVVDTLEQEETTAEKNGGDQDVEDEESMDPAFICYLEGPKEHGYVKPTTARNMAIYYLFTTIHESNPDPAAWKGQESIQADIRSRHPQGNRHQACVTTHIGV